MKLFQLVGYLDQLDRKNIFILAIVPKSKRDLILSLLKMAKYYILDHRIFSPKYHKDYMW